MFTSKALYAMSMFGVGEIVGSNIMGAVVDKFGPKMGTVMNNFNILAMVLVTLINFHVLKYDFLSFLLCFTWGWLDGSLNSHVNQNLGF